MKKNEFLHELDQRLLILSEEERQDILEEYALHIDLKMKNGMEEEAAARDFGDIQVLATEILSAYSLNPNYKQPGIWNKSIHLLKKWGASIKTAFLHGAACTGSFFKNLGSKIAALCTSCRRKLSRFFTKKDTLPPAIEQKEKKIMPNIHVKPVHLPKVDLYNPTKTFFKRLWALTLLLCRCLLLCCLFCLGVPFLGTAAVTLFSLALVLVLLFLGYPLAGIAIALLGLLLCSVSIGCICISYCFRPGKGHRKHRRPEKPMEHMDEEEEEEEYV